MSDFCFNASIVHLFVHLGATFFWLYFIKNPILKNGASFQPCEIQECESRLAELETQEIVHTDVLKCLGKENSVWP